MRRAGRLSAVGIAALAGWLFADMLLVLAVVTMADRPDPLAAASPGPSGKGGASASPSPTPTGPRSLVKKAEKFEVAGTDEDDLVRQIRRQTERWAGREAALVMTFGGSAGGNRYAHRVNSLLGRARPKMFTRNTATEDFHALDEPADTASLTVYFYTSPS
ncbi:hypothetical protein Acsp04_18760 [Actinomadura sp. NBRC 104425]|uniref:hypothetical protein n=1 Tax=Actinomadura sp. NBRC 104425 TaxID=3032204 RepID=UPI0024A05B30|nr:hypothetical protein [Actinomadura sp. NBRC 104425]GLZ11641.1 hypothetical protein Acsp04_18760 [Actinomadura sp. NBRC 104425]